MLMYQALFKNTPLLLHVQYSIMLQVNCAVIRTRPVSNDLVHAVPKHKGSGLTRARYHIFMQDCVDCSN